ncbi:hypothetical protein M9Y10_036237 [Tritrichomonas musculus]|uniref:Non-specific serine/threonine protein kinase n=1 Tax=Tritrichomonas musculus TaxID=1915356 RepID=A0ABR2GVU4_9EUKA
MCLGHFIYSEDLLKTMMSMCTVCIQANSNPSETLGAFIVIRAFIERGYKIIDEKFSDILHSIGHFLLSNQDPQSFEVFAMLCENYKSKADKEREVINKVMKVNWDLNDSKTCDVFVRIASLFPDDFGQLSYEHAQKANEDSYFKLISAHFGPYSNESEIIQKFEEAKLSDSFIDSSYKFLVAYPYNAFKFTSILLNKTNEVLESDDPTFAFKLICKFEKSTLFPFQAYWDTIFESLKFPDLPDEDKKLKTLALFSILKNSNDQCQKLIELLFFLQNDSIPAYCTALENIDDQLLPLFMNETLQLILRSSINFVTLSFLLPSVNIFIRLRKISPLSIFNYFISTFSTIPSTFSQCNSYTDKSTIIFICIRLINGADDLIGPYTNTLYSFFLNLISSPQPPPKSFKDRVNNRKILKEVIKIHISSIECIEKLVQKPYHYDPQLIVDALISQLTLFQNESLHIAALDTLRSVFRNFGFSNINMEALHMQLFDYIKATKSETTLDSILSILGTIGPLDPLSFHLHHAQVDLYPLYDKLKREQSYLDFVIKYLISQLTKVPEPSMFLNAINYIFQFSKKKSSVYLPEIISVLEILLKRGQNDSVFHILRSIILHVEIDIFPFAEQIYAILSPFLVYKNFNLHALKALSAMVFVMKSAFPIAVQTFSMVLDNLSNDCGFDYELYLLQILAHLVIFCNCSQRLFFQQAKKRALTANLISSYALNFISQVIFNTMNEELCLPSVRLAAKLMNDKSPIKESAETLLSIIAEMSPVFITKDIDITKIKRCPNLCEVTEDPYPERTPNEIKPLKVSEIFEKNNFMQHENYWDSWLLHMLQNLVLCSRSPSIRSCLPLLQISTNFLHQMFPLILLSVWEESTDENREMLSTNLAKVATDQNVTSELLSLFCEANDTMDRAGYYLFKSSDKNIGGKIAVECEHFFRAIRFYERSPDSDKDDDVKCQMIKVHARLKRRESALGIFAVTPKAHNDPSILKDLGIWDEARKLFNPNKSETDLIQYIECSSKLEDWGTIMQYADRFNSLTLESKNTVSIYFASAMSIYNKQNIDQFLPFMNRSNVFNCIWQAIIELRMGNYKSARLSVERGMKLNASNRAPFLSGNYEPALQSIEDATFLEELEDVINVCENVVPREKVMQLWNSKSNWIYTDVERVITLFVIRRLLESNDNPQIALSFLESARELKKWDIFDNMFKSLLGLHLNDDRVKLLAAKVMYDRHQSPDLSAIKDIIESTKDNVVFANAVCDYAIRLESPTPDILNLLSKVLKRDPKATSALKIWTSGNLYLARKYNDEKYANDAINGFTSLIKNHNRPILHYLYQLCSLCFSYDINITNVFASLPPSSIEQIIHQLLAQFDNPREAVRNSIAKIVLKFTEEHLQAIAFPLVYMKNLKKETPSPHFTQFLNEIRNKNPEFRAEVNNISKGLIKLSTSEFELISLIFQKAVIKLTKDNDIQYFKNELSKAVNIYFTYYQKKKDAEKTKICERFVSYFNNIQTELNNPESSIFKMTNQVPTNDKLAQSDESTIDSTESMNQSKVSPTQSSESISQSIEKMVQGNDNNNESNENLIISSESLTQSIESINISNGSQTFDDSEQIQSDQAQKDKSTSTTTVPPPIPVPTITTTTNTLCFVSPSKVYKPYTMELLLHDLSYLIRQFYEVSENIKHIEVNKDVPSLMLKSPSMVAVPGFYKMDSDFPRIQSFSRIVKVIPSAKLPRKIRIHGTDGHTYKYLLKGTEDLMLDQRIMQWFSLSNSLLRDDKGGIEKHLTIECYPIIPLSPLAGMIAWAEGSETFYSLISWYNDLKHKPDYITQVHEMLRLPDNKKIDIDALSRIHRLEFYRDLCGMTDDTALREAIWIKSPGADIWFMQKTNFARSMGLMSIVGYIIGLGDRHPNNILFMNKTGKQVHIDFSECFEKATKRSYYPEKVQFRLTRMMVKVLGVSGVEGDFKMTAQYVISLMRRNKSSLLAFLDFFDKGADVDLGKNDINRIHDKLDGNEFEDVKNLSVDDHVDRLIAEATDENNLSQMFIGWLPHW